jgi:hypothetical protein
MPSKYHFYKISNNHVQKILGLNVKQSSYKLNKIRAAYGKTPEDDVRLFEFCDYEKLDMQVVCQMLGWKED